MVRLQNITFTSPSKHRIKWTKFASVGLLSGFLHVPYHPQIFVPTSLPTFYLPLLSSNWTRQYLMLQTSPWCACCKCLFVSRFFARIFYLHVSVSRVITNNVSGRMWEEVIVASSYYSARHPGSQNGIRTGNTHKIRTVTLHSRYFSRLGKGPLNGCRCVEGVWRLTSYFGHHVFCRWKHVHLEAIWRLMSSLWHW